MKKICILKSVTVLAVIIMSIGLLTGCEMKFGNKDEKNKTEAYEEPVKNLIEGLAEANSEKFLNAFPPFISNNEYMKNTFTNEYLQGVLEKAQEDYGANITMSFKVTNKEEISEENIKNKEEDIKSYYNEEVTITKGYKLNTEITTKGNNEEDTDIGEFEVYEIEGKWYIIDF